VKDPNTPTKKHIISHSINPVKLGKNLAMTVNSMALLATPTKPIVINDSILNFLTKYGEIKPIIS